MTHYSEKVSSPLHTAMPEHLQARETYSISDLLRFENARALCTALGPYVPEVTVSYAHSMADPSTQYGEVT